MGAYLVRRLLLLVPTVWLILSVVFLLSRIIPGTYADLREEAELATIGGGKSKPRGRQQYLEQLRQGGYDKPLFYFSVQSQAEPDTLYRVYPPSHQKLLTRLAGQYGNWPRIAAYYTALKTLEQKVQISYPGTDPALKEQLITLLKHRQPDSLAELLRHVEPQVPATLHPEYQAIRTTFDLMIGEATPARAWWPSWRWHGTGNQYHAWLSSLLRGDLGLSVRDQQPVLHLVGEAITNTLLLLGLSLLLVFGLSIELALALMLPRGRPWRKLVVPVLITLDSIPLFLISLLLLTLLAGSGYLNLFPVFGLSFSGGHSGSWYERLGDQLYHLVLPGLCLVLAGMPYVTMQLYRTMQQVAASPYITTARAKGLSPKLVLRRHIFRNALLPLITLFTGFLPALISGAVVVEVIFAIPGTGRLLADSVLARDYPVVLGLILFVATLKASSHLLADFLYFTADPRTRINKT